MGKSGRKAKWLEYAPKYIIPEATVGEVSIKHLKYKPNTSHEVTSLRTQVLGGHTKSDVKFPRAHFFHELVSSKHGRWTTDWPIEQHQQRENTKGFYGCVLVGGLGVGFIAADLALRDEIDEVVVIEINKHVIELVMPHLLPDNPEAKSKIKVVRADLFKYLGKQQKKYTYMLDTGHMPKGLEEFDFAYYDIWQLDGEYTLFETVLPLRKLSNGIVNEVRNWNEDIMRGGLMFSLHGRLATLEIIAAHEEKKKENPDLPDLNLYGKRSIPYTPENMGNYEDSIYWNWSVPFFRWIKQHDYNIGTPNMMKAIGAYAGMFGMAHGWLYVFARRIEELGLEKFTFTDDDERASASASKLVVGT
jgi:hypothetical protein